MRRIKFNINAMTYIQPSERGREILRDYGTSFNNPCPDYLIPDSNGIIRVPLWEVMHIFGRHVFIGKAPFVISNRIEIEISPNEQIIITEEEVEIWKK